MNSEDSKVIGTLLVVDDEETVLTVAAKMLEPFGYKALTARDGLEAVELLRENAEKIDAVILDLTMPDMDGREVLTEAQRIKSGIPVVLSSGYDEEKALQEFGGLELAGFIQKPYTASDLVAKLRKAMKKRDQ